MEDINLPIKEMWFPFSGQNVQGPTGINEAGNTHLPEARVAFNYNYSQKMMIDQ